jgi:hypothetical protein
MPLIFAAGMISSLTGEPDYEPAPDVRGPYGLKVAGFTHIEVNRERMVVRHVDSRGDVLHGFRKTPAGEVVLG